MHSMAVSMCHKLNFTLTCLINEQKKPCLINEQGDIFVENNKRTCCVLPNKRTYWHYHHETISEHSGHMPNKAAE